MAADDASWVAMADGGRSARRGVQFGGEELEAALQRLQRALTDNEGVGVCLRRVEQLTSEGSRPQNQVAVMTWSRAILDTLTMCGRMHACDGALVQAVLTAANTLTDATWREGRETAFREWVDIALRALEKFPDEPSMAIAALTLLGSRIGLCTNPPPWRWMADVRIDHMTALSALMDCLRRFSGNRDVCRVGGHVLADFFTDLPPARRNETWPPVVELLSSLCRDHEDSVSVGDAVAKVFIGLKAVRADVLRQVAPVPMLLDVLRRPAPHALWALQALGAPPSYHTGPDPFFLGPFLARGGVRDVLAFTHSRIKENDRDSNRAAVVCASLFFEITCVSGKIPDVLYNEAMECGLPDVLIYVLLEHGTTSYSTPIAPLLDRLFEHPDVDTEAATLERILGREEQVRLAG